MMLAGIGVFAAIFILDFVWAKYTLAMTERRAAMASGLASTIILLSAMAQIGYTTNPWLIPAAMLGAGAGTFVAVKFDREKVGCQERS